MNWPSWAVGVAIGGLLVYLMTRWLFRDRNSGRQEHS